MLEKTFEGKNRFGTSGLRPQGTADSTATFVAWIPGVELFVGETSVADSPAND